jgi:CheY-like chemotaxis protein/anti-sigma regulatory factor (Ser/Thr protein kinase)
LPEILIVDDEAVDRELARRCLESIESLSVSYAQDGQEALESIRKEQPDLVLSDLRMPTMNGLELVEAARRFFPLLPVILMTSQGSEQIAVRALRAGAASYVPKTDLKTELSDTVRQVLKLAAAKRSERELFRCMQQCETHFELDNDPVLISQLVGYFLNNLERMGFGDDVVRTQVGIALMEAVSNAMIHGNLEVRSELKRDNPEAFDKLIHQRRKQSPYSERRIVCTARESTRRVEFIVTDEGKGFDAGSLPDPIDPENLLRISGRGVMLIRTFMDFVEYNEKGNRITLVKKCPD